jgi:hypothetical protein
MATAVGERLFKELVPAIAVDDGSPKTGLGVTF